MTSYQMQSYNSSRYPFYIHITPDAIDLFRSFIEKHQSIREREEKCSGIYDLPNNVYKFFEYELREKEHQDVAKMVQSNDHIINKGIMKRWIQESWFESFIDKGQCSQLN